MSLLKFAWLDPVQGVTSHFLNKWMEPDPVKFTPEDLEVPESEIGATIGVVFGTRTVKKPHIVWYGDVSITKEAVESSAKK